MKKSILLSLMVLGFSVAARTTVFEKSVASSIHDGYAITQVRVDLNTIDIEHENESGFSCYFKGTFISSSIFGDVYEVVGEDKDFAEDCRVTTKINSQKVLRLNNNGKCLSLCGAGAELKVKGLRMISE